MKPQYLVSLFQNQYTLFDGLISLNTIPDKIKSIGPCDVCFITKSYPAPL